MSNTNRLLIGAALRRLMLVGSLAPVLVVALAGPAVAHPGHARSGLEAPGAHVAGLAPGEWVGRWWEVTLEKPAADQEEPFCASLGRGVVAPFSIANHELTCSVPEGTRVMHMSFTNECSNVEEPPYFGKTPQERRACAVDYDEESLLLLEITVDGRHTRLDRRYRPVARPGRVASRGQHSRRAGRARPLRRGRLVHDHQAARPRPPPHRRAHGGRVRRRALRRHRDPQPRGDAPPVAAADPPQSVTVAGVPPARSLRGRRAACKHRPAGYRFCASDSEPAAPVSAPKRRPAMHYPQRVGPAPPAGVDETAPTARLELDTREMRPDAIRPARQARASTLLNLLPGPHLQRRRRLPVARRSCRSLPR
jgi:hypothetical protein